MVVHDEETLDAAILMVGVGPVRYSDQYMYAIINSRDALEARCHSAFERGDIAVVVPLGTEAEMEDHPAELVKVKARRRKAAQKDIREYFREHPESVENVERHATRRGELKGGDESEE